MSAVHTQTQLPQDQDSAPIQVLAPEETTVVGFVLAATTNPTTLPQGAEIVEVACTGNMKFAFGTGGVNATTGTRRVIPTGSWVYKVPFGATSFDAVTVDGSSGRVTVARLT